MRVRQVWRSRRAQPPHPYRFRALLFASLCASAAVVWTPSAMVAQDGATPGMGDDAHAIQVMRALGRQRSEGAFYALRNRLQDGLPDPVADAAIAALGDLESAFGYQLLRDLTLHHRASARVAAYRAFATHAEPSAAGTLLAEGLGDGDVMVREACARLLASHGSPAQVPRLLLALDHGVQGAVTALYHLGDDDLLLTLAARTKSVPTPVQLLAYEGALLRADLRLDTQVALVGQLQEMGTPQVRHFAERLLLRGDWSNRPRLMTAITTAIARLPKNEAEMQHSEGSK